MKEKFIIIILSAICIFGCPSIGISQAFFTHEKNSFDYFINAEIWTKANFNYSLVKIDKKLSGGLGYNVGILFDYYIAPKIIFRTGLEYQQIKASNSLSYGDSYNKIVSDYEISHSTIKLPFCFTVDLSHKNKGMSFGLGSFFNIGTAGHYIEKENGTTLVDRDAYKIDTTISRSSIFNRFDVGMLFFAAYKFNRRWSVGIEYSQGFLNLMSDTEDNNPISITSGQVGVVVLYSLKRF